jgi:hypothetical protein
LKVKLVWGIIFFFLDCGLYFGLGNWNFMFFMFLIN